MSIALQERGADGSLMTAEELLARPDEKNFELRQGTLLAKQMGNESSQIAALLVSALISFVRPRRLGWVLISDAGYVLPLEGAETVRKPDVSFVSAKRFPANQPLPTGYYKLAPDIAVEVLSPGDLVSEVDTKIEDYLKAGVKLVWIIHPTNRTVLVYRQDRTSSIFRDTDHLDGEDVIAGFRCPIAEIFEILPAQGPSA